MGTPVSFRHRGGEGTLVPVSRDVHGNPSRMASAEVSVPQLDRLIDFGPANGVRQATPSNWKHWVLSFKNFQSPIFFVCVDRVESVAILWSLCLKTRETAVSISSRSNFSARPALYVSAFSPIDRGRSTIALYVLSGFQVRYQCKIGCIGENS